MNLRQQQKEATRQKLYDTAMACFEEQGYGETQIVEITRRAEVATGTFYVHYDGKEAVVDEALEAFNAAFAARLQPIIAGAMHEDGKKRPTADKQRRQLLKRIAEAFLAHWEQNRSFVQIYVERSAGSINIEMLRDGINPPMVALLEEVLKKLGSGRHKPPSPMQRHLLMHGILAFWLRLGLQHLFAPDCDKHATLHVLTHGTEALLAQWYG